MSLLNSPNTSNNSNTNNSGNNSGNKKAKNIEIIIQNLDKLENSDDWNNIIKLQRQLIKLLSESLTEQKQELKEISNKVNGMNQRLKTNTIPYNDMEKLANILKPFLAKTYQVNKKDLFSNKS